MLDHHGGNWRVMDSAQFLLDLHTFNDTEMANKYGVHRKTIYRKRKELGIPNPHINGVTQRPIFNLPEFEEADPDELWNLAEKLRQKILQEEYRVETCEVSLMDESPVMVVWLADWHIGHISTDLGRLRYDLEVIKETPGVYVAFGGDYTENTNTSRASRGTYHEQLVPIRVQKRLAERAVELVSEKILVMLKGNHDAWSEQSDDFDFVEYMAKNINVPYLGDWGFIDIALQDQKYTGLMAHKGRGGGKDKSAPAKNLVNLMGHADFGFTGHKHESSISEEIVRGKPVVYGTAGSYLESGRYGRGLSLPDSVSAMPGVVLFSDTHKVFPVRNSLEDLWVLEGARAFGMDSVN